MSQLPFSVPPRLARTICEYSLRIGRRIYLKFQGRLLSEKFKILAIIGLSMKQFLRKM